MPFFKDLYVLCLSLKTGMSDHVFKIFRKFTLPQPFLMPATHLFVMVFGRDPHTSRNKWRFLRLRGKMNRWFSHTASSLAAISFYDIKYDQIPAVPGMIH